MNKPLKGFITYSHEDTETKDKLRKHLAIMGIDMIAAFHYFHESVADFEAKHGIQLPPDIAAMLTPQ